jgi:biotin carboxylase
MKITTEKPVAIVLGGTNPHRELILKLKEQGYYTVLIDYLSNPPAKEVADEHIVESTLDKETVLRVAKSLNASLVTSICVDQAHVVAAWISGEMGLPKFFDFQIVSKVADKMLQKEGMVHGGIPTAKFKIARSAEVPNIDELTFPLVTKPLDTTGSKGVVKVMHEADLKNALTYSNSFTSKNYLIIEEFIEGEEFQVDCFSTNDKVYLLLLSRKNKLHNGDVGKELQSVGSEIVPFSDFNEGLIAEFQKIATSIKKLHKLNSTPFFFQCIVKGSSVLVLEYALRIGGGLSYKIIPMVSGVDSLGVAMNVLLNKPLNISPCRNEFRYRTNNIYVSKCVFGEVKGTDELIRKGIVEAYFPYKLKGASISGGLSSNNRLGAFIVKATSREELEEKRLLAYQELRVVDIENNEIPIIWK